MDQNLVHFLGLPQRCFRLMALDNFPHPLGYGPKQSAFFLQERAFHAVRPFFPATDFHGAGPFAFYHDIAGVFPARLFESL